jgi:hypothetical protein
MTVDLAEWHRKQCQAKYNAENAAYSPPPQCFTLHHPTESTLKDIKSNRREGKKLLQMGKLLSQKNCWPFQLRHFAALLLGSLVASISPSCHRDPATFG